MENDRFFDIVEVEGQDGYFVVTEDKYDPGAYEVLGNGDTKEKALEMAFERLFRVYTRHCGFVEMVQEQLNHNNNYDLKDEFVYMGKYCTGESVDGPFKFNCVWLDKDTKKYVPYCR